MGDNERLDVQWRASYMLYFTSSRIQTLNPDAACANFNSKRRDKGNHIP